MTRPAAEPAAAQPIPAAPTRAGGRRGPSVPKSPRDGLFTWARDGGGRSEPRKMLARVGTRPRFPRAATRYPVLNLKPRRLSGPVLCVRIMGRVTEAAGGCARSRGPAGAGPGGAGWGEAAAGKARFNTPPTPRPGHGAHGAARPGAGPAGHSHGRL